MRLAIADPPYLGRSAIWFGGHIRTGSGSAGRARGRGELSPEYHTDAERWDDPEEHRSLMARLDAEFDGWALAASSKTLHLIVPAMPDSARIAVWHVTNAMPDGSRIKASWEAVIVRTPEGRRAYGSGPAVPDVLTCGAPRAGFVGAKPGAWTRWVLDMLGYQPGDDVEDLFPGSGSVTSAMGVLL